MDNELDDVLHHAAEDSVASLAFMLLMEPEGGNDNGQHAGETGEKPWAAEADFAGPVNGKIALLADEGVAAELAERMLCLPRTCRDRKRAAVTELLRVICRKVLPELSDGENRCCVHEPRVLPRDPSRDAPTGRPAASTRLELADGAIDVTLYIDRYSANGRSAAPVAATRR